MPGKDIFSDQPVVTGEWWFPSVSTRKFRGELEHRRDSSALSLRLFAKDADKGLHVKIGQPTYIYGILHRGDCVTLLHNYMYLSEHGGSGQVIFHFYSMQMIIGKRSVQRRTFLVPEILVSLDDIHSWFTFAHLDLSNTSHSVRIHYGGQNNVNFKTLNPNLKIQFQFCPLYRHVGYEASVNLAVFLRFISQKPSRTVHWWEERIFDILNVIELFAARRPRITNIAISGQNGERLGDIFRPGWGSAGGIRTLAAHNGIPFHECKGPLARAFRRINQDPDLARILSLFLGLVRPSELAIETQFLLACQALEWFHRIRFKGMYCDETEYRRAISQILHEIGALSNNDLRRRLEGIMAFGHEFSFRRRLKDLAGRIEPFSHFIDPKMRDFIQAVVDQRNYLVHRDPKASPGTKDARKIIENFHRLEPWLLLLLLKDFGATEKMLQTMVNKSPAFRYGLAVRI